MPTIHRASIPTSSSTNPLHVAGIADPSPLPVLRRTLAAGRLGALARSGICRKALTSLLLAASLVGCGYPKADGEALRKEVDALKQQLQTNREAAKQERAKLQKVMEQVTSLLTRNNADVGAQVERMQTKIAKMVGQMEQALETVKKFQGKFDDFKAKVDVKLEGLSGQSSANKNAPVPKDKDQLFKLAQTKFAANDYQEARRLLRHFMDRFGADARLHKAQLMLGDSYFAEQKFAPAIVEYKKIIEQHKKSASVPDALFKIGMAFYQLKFCTDAALFFRELRKNHRRHPQIKRAKKVLKLIKRYRGNRNMCRP